MSPLVRLLKKGRRTAPRLRSRKKTTARKTENLVPTRQRNNEHQQREEYSSCARSEKHDLEDKGKYASCGKDCSKPSRCSRCKVATYCDRACQEKDWKQHKQFCRHAASTAGEPEAVKKDTTVGRTDVMTTRRLAIVSRIQDLLADRCVPKECRARQDARMRVAHACREQMAVMIPVWRKMKSTRTPRTNLIQEWNLEGPEAELSLLELEWFDTAELAPDSHSDAWLGKLKEDLYKTSA